MRGGKATERPNSRVLSDRKHERLALGLFSRCQSTGQTDLMPTPSPVAAMVGRFINDNAQQASVKDG